LPKHLQFFSIRSNLSYSVKKIKLLYIDYNRQGVPTDSYEETVNPYDPIRPHLAYRKDMHDYGGIADIKSTEEWEIRVLDFEIIK